MEPVDIEPPPDSDFEVRVVVWRTEGVASEDALTDMNDLYIKVLLDGVESANNAVERGVRAGMNALGSSGGRSQGKASAATDTHWRLQNGAGSFNFRMK